MSSSNRPIIALNGAGVCYRLKRKIDGSNRYWALNDVTLDVRKG